MSGAAPKQSASTVTTPLTARQERALLDGVDHFLSTGVELKDWWAKARLTNDFDERFEESVSYNRPDSSFGYFAHADIGGRDQPIMGNFQSMYYDQPKSSPRDTHDHAGWMQDQMREFVLRYFMRVSDFRRPQAFMPASEAPLPNFLRPINFCPTEDPTKIGFGFTQLFFKRRDTGEIGKFSASERKAIVDLRTIGEIYDWIVVDVDIFDFSFEYSPLGEGAPELRFPLATSSYLVISSDFVTNEDNLEPGVLGRYGIGYAFIRNPKPSVLNYGPGEFEFAFETIDFSVSTDGRVRVDMAFATNRPKKIVKITLDPFSWGLRAGEAASLGLVPGATAISEDLRSASPFKNLSADPISGLISLTNLLTGGLASRRLCISQKQLFKSFLVKHFEQHYQTVVGSLRTWRQIPDWLDTDKLPGWVKSGGSG